MLAEAADHGGGQVQGLVGLIESRGFLDLGDFFPGGDVHRQCLLQIALFRLTGIEQIDPEQIVRQSVSRRQRLGHQLVGGQAIAGDHLEDSRPESGVAL